MKNKRIVQILIAISKKSKLFTDTTYYFKFSLKLDNI